MNVRLAEEKDRQGWDDFLLRSHGSFLQTWAWGDFQASLGRKIWRFIGEEGGAVKATALVIKQELPMGLCWLYVPGFQNPLYTSEVYNGFEGELMKIATEEKAIFVRADFVEEPASHPGGVPDLTHRTPLRQAPRGAAPRGSTIGQWRKGP